MKAARALEEVVDGLPPGAGVIGLLSGDEYTGWALDFDRAMLAEAGSRMMLGEAEPERMRGEVGPRVGLLLCADHDHAEENARRAEGHFRALGADPFVVEVEHGTRARARKPVEFDLLYVGGGSPLDLIECMRGSSVWADALDRWHHGKSIAGSSAGAMALAVHCLIPKKGADKPTVWAEGLGPLEKVGLAVHATSRPAEWLEEVTKSTPVPVLALDDHAGVILRPGKPPQVIGDGAAWIEE